MEHAARRIHEESFGDYGQGWSDIDLGIPSGPSFHPTRMEFESESENYMVDHEHRHPDRS